MPVGRCAVTAVRVTGERTAVHVDVVEADHVDHPAVRLATHFRVGRRVAVVDRAVAHRHAVRVCNAATQRPTDICQLTRPLTPPPSLK